MEIEKYPGNSEQYQGEANLNADIIQVRANISCPSCSYKKTFKNKFKRKDIELMIVSLKVFDFMSCPRCGDLLGLDLDFII